jgi:hypothetical protein
LKRALRRGGIYVVSFILLVILLSPLWLIWLLWRILNAADVPAARLGVFARS